MEYVEKVARFDALDRALAEDRIARKAWRVSGTDRVCLLVALAPEVEAASDASSCPADLLPTWWAELTVDIDDYGSLEAWPSTIRYWASVTRRAALTLDAAEWRRVEIRIALALLAEGRTYNTDFFANEAYNLAVNLWERELTETPANEAEWKFLRDRARDEDVHLERVRQHVTFMIQRSAGKYLAGMCSALIGLAVESLIDRQESEKAWDRLSLSLIEILEEEVQSPLYLGREKVV